MSAEHDHAIANAKDGERPSQAFVAYAWPTNSSYGRRIFAITQEGKVYASLPAKSQVAPAWNDLFGGKGWHDPVVWLAWRRGSPGTRLGGPTTPLPTPSA